MGGQSEEFLANWASQARKGTLELVIMTLLESREFYGYELVEHIHSHCGLEVKDGTLYAIMTRLKSEGFVRHRWEHMESGPARKYYALTQTGKKALQGMNEAWDEIVHAIKEARAGK